MSSSSMENFFLDKDNEHNKRKKAEGEEKDILTLSVSSNRQVKSKQQNSQSKYVINISPLLVPSTSSTGLDLNPNPGVADVDINMDAQRTPSHLVSPLLLPSTASTLDLNPIPEVADVDINIGTQRISSAAPNLISPLLMPSTLSSSRVADVEHTSSRIGGNQMANVNVNMGIQRNTLRSARHRRSPSQGLAQGKSETIPPPFPWATNRRAYVHSRNHLMQNNILSITGKVQCKRCEKKFEMAFNLDEKLRELCMFIQKNRGAMHDRAPKAWVDPVLPKCEYCGQENSVRPFLANTKKKEINWLFLLLGQMLGCCTLDQLKYFCKHTQNHRTGAKDRVLYSTYMGLCQQLIPDGVI